MFGAEASISWTAGAPSGSSGQSVPSAMPTHAEHEAAKYAPLVMHLRQYHDKALSKGTDDELAKAVRASMIALSYMGANPANLTTPIRSVVDVALIERYEPMRNVGWFQNAIAEYDKKLFGKLMVVANEVAAMAPSKASLFSAQIGIQSPKASPVTQIGLRPIGTQPAPPKTPMTPFLTGSGTPAASVSPALTAPITTPPEMLGPGGLPWMWIGLGVLALGVGGFVVYSRGKK